MNKNIRFVGAPQPGVKARREAARILTANGERWW